MRTGRTVSSLRGNAEVMGLLRSMQTKGDRRAKEFARICGMSESGFSKLRERLATLGVIKRTVSILNADAMGIRAVAFFEFWCSQSRAAGEWLEARPEVLEVHWLGGPVLIKVKTSDLQALQDFKEALGGVPGVRSIRAKLALITTKETTALPI